MPTCFASTDEGAAKAEQTGYTCGKDAALRSFVNLCKSGFLLTQVDAQDVYRQLVRS